MFNFNPKRVFIEKKALDYKLGVDLWHRFNEEGKEVIILGSNRVTGLPGDSLAEKFSEAKQTLVIAVRRSLKFASCKPSADYQLVTSTSCPGKCEYCYLHTTLGRQPVVRLYVNINEILAQADRLTEERTPSNTTFEGSATTDPIPLERFSGSLAQVIEFFSKREHAYFRFVTKFTEIEEILTLSHNGHTTIRFSVNTPEIIKRYEHGTPSLERRLAAAVKIAAAGYPIGFLIAPIMFQPDWQRSYKELINTMCSLLPANAEPSFELITHRFTKRGKANIQAVFPNSTLPLDESERRFKFGQFGYGKYLYSLEKMKDAEEFFKENLLEAFPRGKLLYFV